MSDLIYWYIDDENGSPEQSTVHSLAEYGVVVKKLDMIGKTDFGDLKRAIIRLAKKNNFAGLIVDLRLDGTINAATSTDYNATALAQELRSISSANRRETPIYPIILTSTEEKINNTYINDKTSHDLFDYKMYKYSDDINWEKRARKLSSLSQGYNFIIQNLVTENDANAVRTTLESCLNKDIDKIHNRLIVDKLLEVFSQLDIHYTIDFILKQLFHYSNPLINQRVLFAKLGVYIDSVAETDKETIFTFFNEALYTGVFSKGWQRWWKHDIEQTLKQEVNLNFSSLTADQRVEIINNKLKTNLMPSEPIELNYSNNFTTICEATKLPLDHLEGFKLNISHNYLPWQMYKYISLHAILDGRYEKLKPHISEKNRLDEEKKYLKSQK